MTGAVTGLDATVGGQLAWEEMMLQKIQTYHLDVVDNNFIKCFFKKILLLPNISTFTNSVSKKS